ncbi:YcgN family cysteine cluster protein [Croceicoccus hydrothermalis]|uniref:YcgN family cysteine cluster protein n=1 Tax=Croceicoccus hydrothermalis TaxID=2867964 RepID=UPI001EFB5577|nr:YcgN family cysteine cluster protein [Croceicoccus hydrothermalis]
MGAIKGPVTGDPPFWEKPLAALDDAEWEALCDGCGNCCLHKLEDADTGEIYPTNVACRLLDTQSARCTDYPDRKAKVPDCLQLTREKAHELHWLPDTCAYRLRANGEPLRAWHYLICGDRDAVHRAGISVAGKVISEDDAGPIEEHVVIPGYELVLAPDGEENGEEGADEDGG